MLEALTALPEARGLAIEVADVDACPEERMRWGHKIPVLLLDGRLVCHGRLDVEEMRRALAALRPGL
jgi:hypothetical protein